MGFGACTLEAVALNVDFWCGKRVLLTGHTGFKGAWLALILLQSGAELTGFSLKPPSSPNLFDLLGLAGEMDSQTADVRDLEAVRRTVRRANPEIVFHLAAQAVVRSGYDDPVTTYGTNVMGTVNVLECLRTSDSLKAAVIVTSDKCYANQEWIWGYRENEPLGGDDPYSSSKGAAELVAQAYRKSLYSSGVGIATARAGNVIGGGDWSKDRLVVDVVSAALDGREPMIRNPSAVRPWQHVLEPLNGYLRLAECLAGDPETYAGCWNFGPHDASGVSVEEVMEMLLGALDRPAVCSAACQDRRDNADAPRRCASL
jgi:CDP-glucose 4,6-dehydratase